MTVVCISCPNCKKIVKIRGKRGEVKIITCPKCKTRGYYEFDEKTTILNINKKNELLRNILLYGIITVFLYLSIFIFESEDFFLLLIMITIISLNFFIQIDIIKIIVFSFSLLIFSAIGLAFYKDITFANQFAINMYWLIIVGVLCHIINILRIYWKVKKQNLYC